jgi:SPP1 gp7 family putative phage head morphogenesis protein
VTLQSLVRSILAWARANVIEVAAAERANTRARTAFETLTVVGDDAGQNARSVIEGLRREAERAAAVAEGRANTAISRYGATHTRQWTAAVNVGAQIDVSRLLADDDLVDLISIKQAEFSSLIKNLSEDVRYRIERQTLGSIFEGRSNADISKSLREIDGIGRNRARLIARDQASKLNGAMNEFRQRQAGVTHYRWRTIVDGRERDTHRARNGKVYAWSTPPPGTGHPGTQVNCRCRAIAVLIDDPADAEAAGVGVAGDPADPFDTVANAELLSTVAGRGDDVLSFSREAALVRAAEVKRAQELVAAAKAEVAFLEADAEELFETIFGFASADVDLERMSGSKLAAFNRRRTLLFAAITSRLDMLEELAEHAALTAET